MAVNVANAMVLPEHIITIIGTVLGRGAYVNQEMENLQKEMVLVVDIGANLQQPVNRKKRSPFKYNRHIANIGGNNVTQTVRLAVTKNLGFRPDQKKV